MIKIIYGENKEKSIYNISDAIVFAYQLWKKGVYYKYVYKNIELIEHNSWDFIEIEKCIEVQIELIDRIIKNDELK